jgi:carboxyl-terminal processing protease
MSTRAPRPGRPAFALLSSAALLLALACAPIHAQEPATPEKPPAQAPALRRVAPATRLQPTCRGEAGAILPLQDLRIFAEVFNQIRTAYVEPVDDRTRCSRTQ